MKIAGLNKTTLLDYPELVAATVFTMGCNFCCPFCHNRDLVLGEGISLIPEEEVLAFLEKRRKVLAGVCISGGEPTLQPDLKDFIHKIKRLGYRVKLDTNGYRPEVIKALLAENLLDYLAMDIKNSKEKYGVTAGRPELAMAKIEESAELIGRSGIPYEFRTTIVRELHREADLMEIGRWIGPFIGTAQGQDDSDLMKTGTRMETKGRYSLQNFEENENVIQAGFHSYPPAEMREFARKLSDMGIVTTVKGVEGNSKSAK